MTFTALCGILVHVNATHTAESVTCYDRAYDLREFAKSIQCSHVSKRAIREAQTGSCYLTVSICDSGDLEEVTIRVSDHADAYATSSYSADGTEGTDEGAREFLKARTAGKRCDCDD